MKKLRLILDLILIFVVGGILYVAVVGGALWNNLRKELRR